MCSGQANQPKGRRLDNGALSSDAKRYPPSHCSVQLPTSALPRIVWLRRDA